MSELPKKSGDSVETAHIYETRRGKHGGGTQAHWQIAFAYAIPC